MKELDLKINAKTIWREGITQNNGMPYFHCHP